MDKSTKPSVEDLQGQIKDLSDKLGLALQNNDTGLMVEVQRQLQSIAADPEEKSQS